MNEKEVEEIMNMYKTDKRRQSTYLPTQDILCCKTLVLMKKFISISEIMRLALRTFLKENVDLEEMFTFLISMKEDIEEKHEQRRNEVKSIFYNFPRYNPRNPEQTKRGYNYEKIKKFYDDQVIKVLDKDPNGKNGGNDRD